jgi:hypothetical protein
MVFVLDEVVPGFVRLNQSGTRHEPLNVEGASAVLDSTTNTDKEENRKEAVKTRAEESSKRTERKEEREATKNETQTVEACKRFCSA